MKCSNNNTSTVHVNSKNNASVPLTTRNMKECDGSISTGLTSKETKNSNSRVGSTVHVGNPGETKFHSKNVMTGKKSEI